MSDFNHDPRIIEQADFLKVLQRNGQQVMINLFVDEQMQTASHYYGMIEKVTVDVPDPYVDIHAEKLVVEFFSDAHRNIYALFDSLREMRKAVVEDESLGEALNNDMVLMDALESELDTEHSEQTIELHGISQRIAISGISMTFGLGS